MIASLHERYYAQASEPRTSIKSNAEIIALSCVQIHSTKAALINRQLEGMDYEYLSPHDSLASFIILGSLAMALFFFFLIYYGAYHGY